MSTDFHRTQEEVKFLLPGYTLNPYFGCPHQCAYCYNQGFVKRIRPDTGKWGTFLEVKINVPEILAKEIKNKPRSSVFLSTVTDPYNFYERKYQLTRACLEILLKAGWSATILTKSSLVLRDLPLFKEFKKNIKIGFTLTTLDPKISRILEPGASLSNSRLKALELISRAEIKTYIFVAPVLPYFTDLEAIFKLVRKVGVKELWFDTLNTRAANWQGIMRFLRKFYPNLIGVCHKIFFQQREQYEAGLREKINVLALKYKIKTRIYF